MLESFIKYTAEEPWNIDRVTDFLAAHSARVRKKVERNQSFSQQEMDEIQEFGKYFIEQYADEEGLLDQEIADCYDEIPFILRVISSYFDYQEEMAKTEFLSSISDDGLKEGVKGLRSKCEQMRLLAFFLRRNIGKYFQHGRKSGIVNICKNIWKD